MSSDKKNISSAAVFTKLADGRCRAVKLEKTTAGYRLAWKHTAAPENIDKLIEGQAAKDISSSQVCSVIGIDQGPVAFYNIQIPAVAAQQLDSLVRMQAESILPLPLEQMETAYLYGTATAGKTRVTIAAARTRQLKSYLPFIAKCKAEKIVLNCQGVIKAFCTFFDIPWQKYVIVNISSSDTQVLLSEDSKLAGASRIDIGSNDLSGNAISSPELFLHDVCNALELFGLENLKETAVYVFSASADLSTDIATGLNNAGLNAFTAQPQTATITSDVALTDEDFSEYLDVISAAILALDGEEQKLDLFSDIINAGKKDAGKNSLLSLIKSVILFTVMLAVTFLVFSVINKNELTKLGNDDIDKLIAEQKVRKLIAQKRPDILELITLINKDAPAGTMIDSISFKKGEPVTIASHASSLEQIYKLEAFFSGRKGFTNVKIQNPSFDQKTKKFAFKINFHYNNWTKKSLR